MSEKIKYFTHFHCAWTNYLCRLFLFLDIFNLLIRLEVVINPNLNLAEKIFLGFKQTKTESWKVRWRNISNRKIIISIRNLINQAFVSVLVIFKFLLFQNFGLAGTLTKTGICKNQWSCEMKVLPTYRRHHFMGSLLEMCIVVITIIKL